MKINNNGLEDNGENFDDLYNYILKNEIFL